MDVRQIIDCIRKGDEPTQAQLNWFAGGLASGKVSDAQAGAFAMAVLLKGLSEEGRIALTLAMRDSGEVLKWDFEHPVVDKHSTGGLGDCVSLVLAPLLAALDVRVPMISGRGLAHTGGTLDKLEAIPGVNTDVEIPRFRQMVEELGFAIVSASSGMAAADKRLYAIRDITGTVPSIDLITASILSKKLAAGLDGLILDVKCGSGTFMETLDEARILADALVSTANGAGCRTAALITDMSQPLASATGNALEIAEVMTALTEPRNSRLIELCLALGAELMVLGGYETAPEVAAVKLRDALTSGQAAAKFDALVTALGGPNDFSNDWRQRLPEASVIREIPAPNRGVVSAYDGFSIGMGVVHLGGGRMQAGDRIDMSVGFSEILRIGDAVEKGAPLARLHAANEKTAIVAEQSFLRAVTIAEDAKAPELLLDRVG